MSDGLHPAVENGIAIAKQVVIIIGVLAAISFVVTALNEVATLTQDVRGTAAGVDAAKLRLLLSSTALYVGVAFAALGFGLFLIGAQGSFKTSGTSTAGVPALETTAPGLVVFVCATVVIYLALKDLSVDTMERKKASPAAAAATAATAPPAADFSLFKDGGVP